MSRNPEVQMLSSLAEVGAGDQVKLELFALTLSLSLGKCVCAGVSVCARRMSLCGTGWQRSWSWEEGGTFSP